jgi:hypothetical protein
LCVWALLSHGILLSVLWLLLICVSPPPPFPPQPVDADDDAALAALQSRSERAASHKPKGRHIRGKASKREARTTAEIMAAVEGHRRAAEEAEGEGEAPAAAGAGAAPDGVKVRWACGPRVCGVLAGPRVGCTCMCTCVLFLLRGAVWAVCGVLLRVLCVPVRVCTC